MGIMISLWTQSESNGPGISLAALREGGTLKGEHYSKQGAFSEYVNAFLCYDGVYMPITLPNDPLCIHSMEICSGIVRSC